MDIMQRYHAAYPGLTEVFSIGKSIQGRDLMVMRISNPIDSSQAPKPKMKWIANMHGNEATGHEICIHFIQYLLDNYGLDDRVTHIVDTIDVHIMPSLNPDGHEVASDNACGRYGGRENAAGYDLNRNFPDQFEGTKQRIQPETQAVLDWLDRTHFVLSANLHDGSKASAAAVFHPPAQYPPRM